LVRMERETGMADGREEGIAALERGDNAAAIALLAAACRQDPDDFPAHLGLGQALLRSGQAHEAIRALERAVALAPPSPDARRELGLALAAAGRTQEALHTLQHALTLRPNDRIALAALDRLRQDSAPPAQPAVPVYRAIMRQISPGRAVEDIDAIAMPEPSGPPIRHALLLDPDAEIDEPTQPLPAFNSGMSPALIAGAPSPGGLTGHEPTLYALPPLPGAPITEQAIPHYGFPATASNPAGRPFGGPHNGPPWAGSAEPEQRHDDDFSVVDGYYDLLEILAAPRDFFFAQVGREGNRAPLAMLATYTLNIALGLLAVLFTTGSTLGVSGMFVVLLSPIWILLLYAALTTVMVGGSALLYAGAALLRSQASYSGSFRAVVYTAAPVCTAVAVGLILSPIKPHNGLQSTLLAALPYALAAICPLWSMGLLFVALRTIHALPTQRAIVILCLLAAVVVGCGLFLSQLPIWS
jgi:hypothetical protein